MLWDLQFLAGPDDFIGGTHNISLAHMTDWWDSQFLSGPDD